MNKSRSHLWGLALKLGALLAVTIAFFVLVVNAMRNPVDGAADTYTAEFTDVSGLHVNGDVRNLGMRIGKVQSIELHTGPSGATAEVGFTMDKNVPLTSTTQLAIKYESLTGIRYLDVQEGAQGGDPVTSVPLSRTKPSFDITVLFNGLEPVLSTMRTTDVNAFTANAIALIQGDGSGLGPMLESTQKLMDYAKDRQQVISDLVANMSRISDTMGGRSGYVVDFLHAIEMPIDNAMAVLDKFQTTAVTGPALMGPIDRVVTDLGFSADQDWDQLIGKYFHSVSDALKTLEVLPGAVSGIESSRTSPGTSKNCSRGRAQLPAAVQVLLNGSEVVLCAQ